MDATFDLLSQVNKGKTDHPIMFMMSDPVYNIDDMDGRAYMIDHRMSGCMCINSTKEIAKNNPGQIFINDKYAGEAIIGNPGFMGQVIGIFLRTEVTEYDKDYNIRYEGAIDMDGMEMFPFEFTIHTLAKIEPCTEYSSHDCLVLQAARESAVLLKNKNNALPFAKGSVVNAFGKGAPAYRLGCVGAAKINPRYGIRFEEGIKKYSSLILNEELFEFYRKDEKDVMPGQEILDKAKAASNTAIYIITRGTGEGEDNLPVKGNYYLTDEEVAMLQGLSINFEKVVVILNVGYPIEMGWVEEYHIDAVLWSGLNGMAGGRAIAEILEGSVSPSGKLPDTWSMDYFDIPASRNFYLPSEGINKNPMAEGSYTTIVYEEGLYVGYRYFDTFQKKAAYIFGHGLCYTQFKKETVKIQQKDALVSLDIKVTNVGKMQGKEVVLIFAEIADGKLEQPKRRLVAFGKTDEIVPGAKEVLHFDILPERFNSYDEERAAWVIEQGIIKLYVGGSVKEAEYITSFNVNEEIITSQVKNRIQPPIEIRELSKNDPEGTYPRGELTAYHVSEDLPYRRLRTTTPEKNPIPCEKPTNLVTFPMIVQDETLLDEFVAQMDDYELSRASIGGRTGWGVGDSGFAGTLYNVGKMQKFEIPDYFFSDGNNGLNMNEANVGFPVSNLMAATFNEKLSYEEGRVIGIEAKDMNLHCVLAPAMNLHRNPLCGRHAEYFCEDPYLSGRMAGMESKGLESVGISSSIKHLFANNAETLRNSSHSLMTERTARELYLKSFEVAFEVNMPDTVMTGYNPANGVWCAGDEELLQGILREEWGFNGYVITDWGSSRKCDAVLSTQAGNCWIAPGSMDDREVTPMVDALAEGRLDRERLRRNVRDMYAVLRKYFVISGGK